MAETKRTRRSPEEMAAARAEKEAALNQKIEQFETAIRELEEKKEASAAGFDAKIAAIHAKIEKVQKQKEALLTPKKPAAKKAKKPGRKPAKKRRTQTVKIQEMVKQARKSGMKLEEIAEKLGIEIEE